MKAVESIKLHYRSVLARPAEPIEVPEWSLNCYIRPSISMEQHGKILHLASQGNHAESVALKIIYHLVDDEGSRVFSIHDKLTFMKEADPTVVSTVSHKIDLNGISQKEVVESVTNSPDVQFQYMLAERLHKSVAEIQQLDETELAGWVAWFDIMRRQSSAR